MVRILCLVLLACLLAPAAQAQTDSAPAALAPLYACRGLPDTERLQCFDQQLDRLSQAEAAGDLAVVDRAQASAVERDSFGFSLPSLAGLFRNRATPEAPLEQIEAEVQQVLSHPDGRHSFVHTNGQRWTQVVPDNASNVRPGHHIAIHRAAMGSFMLSPEHGQAHRVRRAE